MSQATNGGSAMANEPKNRRVLLIDDMEAIHQDFKKILTAPASASQAASDARAAFFGPAAAAPATAETYTIESARQGQEALEKTVQAIAAKQPFALAFVDVRMPPGWDGVETIQRLWKVDPDLQVVICSAYSDYSWSDMIAKLGRSDSLLILKKPFDPVEVCQLACALVEKWNATRRERLRTEQARRAEQEARAYAASLVTVNRALETAKARAETSAQAKSEFLANMSHEIRTPMIAVLGYADLLHDASLPPATREEHLATIEANGRKLLGVLDDVLDMARIETGRLEVEQRACTPYPLVEEVVASLQETALAKGLELSVHRKGPLPDAIRTDPARLRQIVTALVDNAIRFTNAGSVEVHVSMENAEVDGEPRLQIDVVDTGIGITPEVRARLFETFYQGDSSPMRERGGAGLGLALSKRLSQMLGGDIGVESTPGEGSRFVLTVSALPADLGRPGPTEVSAGKQLPAAPATLTGRVLVVEDSPVTRRLHELFLHIAGAEVWTADNGETGRDIALEALGAGRPFDLILMDMQMPVMDGYAATRELRARGYRGAILAFTAHAHTGDRDRCLEVGCDDYVAKPVERAALVEICRGWMGRTAPPGPLPARKSEIQSGRAIPR